MSDSSLMRATTVMASGTFVSRLLGLVRVQLLTGLLGVSGALAADGFATANTVPNQLYNLIAGGLLNAVLVPQIVQATKHSDGGQAFLDRLLTISLLGMAVVTLVATLLSPLVPLVFGPSTGPGWDASTIALVVAFAYWCLPQVFFYGVYTVLGQVLNARGRFGAYMWAPVANNVVAIAGLVVMFVWIGGFNKITNPHPPSTWTAGQIAVLAGSATLGVVVQALVVMVPLRRMGFRYRPRFGFRGVGLGGAGRVAAWTFAGALMGQLGFIVTSRAVNAGGSLGGPGQNAYGSAFLLFMLPHSLITVSLVTALFTRMSHAAHERDTRAVRRDLSVGLRLTGVASVLALVGMLAVGDELTRVLFFKNSAAETFAIAAATTAMMLGLVSFSAQYLFQRAFYAYQDARTPFLIQIPVVLVIAATSFASARELDPDRVVVGIGVGMAAGYTVGAVQSAVVLRRRLGGLDGARVLRTYVRLVCAGLPAVAVGQGVSAVVHVLLGHSVGASLVALVLGGSLVLVVYVGVLRLLRVDELDELAEPLLRRLPGRH
ncbi:murein biosynthesis integral membrane protein MurJ [Angustibacter luteus]|uniref:Murein biosynthesis integral membrane protein MurJ n=1 Tax=Angustibacter luteus TaxID=658456 RepID=A0ABW1JEA9_9ACTN